jgi:hypothetical protein
MARDKADRGELLSSKSCKKSKNLDSDDDDMSSRIGDLASNEPPEPEVLLAILNRKPKK